MKRIKPGFPIWLWYLNGLTTRDALIHAGCDATNATTEGDTQWVKKKTRRFN